MKDGFSLIELLEHTYQLYPDKEYLYDGKKSFTYKQLFHEVHNLAAGLERLGVQKGERVLVCLPNCHEFIVVFFSLIKIGATMIPCNPCYRKEDITPILTNDEINFIFTSNIEHVAIFQNFGVERIVTVHLEDIVCLSYQNLLCNGEKLRMKASNNQNETMVNRGIAAILYTSGTTGQPKGVMLSHKNLYYAAETTRRILNCTHLDRIFTPVPVFHVFGLVPGVILTILTGAKIILMEKYNATKALQLIEDAKATIHLGVPTMFILELNHLTNRDYDLSTLRTGIVAGSSCPSEIVKRIRNEMGCDIRVSYGLTETASALTFTTDEDDELVCSETVGKPVPGSEIKIVDNNHQELAIGEIGELACKGPGVMNGYFRMPKETRNVIEENGWFYTSDLASINENGYVTIVGRKKDMIIRGGFKVYPSEIEDVLHQHPSVFDVAVVGAPNPVLGEISIAFIKLKFNHCGDEEHLKGFVAVRLAKYKVPDKVIFLDELPLSASGKIRRDVLREMVKIGALAPV
ncbi:class I adenylate-forming enzyme family protein [Bacillus sp. B15-48]|uniref:class I adenylate-forming enzyme family protein n=1 Tax=Bacillus sp. B15-48 TaxID=1548601 RepID=UPI00193FE403|nr:class I adenylate-forming enzyme family protein [Bacillus sp. B15-48]MBM4764687.1 AMP-binding protein [Bacillus sp. B15-48]